MAPAEERILVVDDDDDGRYVKVRTLALQGYTVSESALGRDAVAQVAAAPPDLVLLDVRLPDIDGIAVCRNIKSAFPHVAVLQTSSALINAHDRALALNAGADSYLIEPIEPDELVAAVRALLRMRQAEHALRDMNETLEARVAERTRALEESHRRLEFEQASRRQAEDILWHTQKLEAVGRLTGGIAHDFNNLLTVITGNLELLQNAIGGGRRPTLERQFRLIGAALKAAEHGAHMTQQLLAFARRGVLRSRNIDLNAVIATMTGFLGRTLGDAITLDVVGDPDLWLCRIDPIQFEAALLNLTINARDAMPEGGRLLIRLRNCEIGPKPAEAAGPAPGAYICVDVGDTGVGMAPDVVERAFEPFFTTKNIGEGSGLGLSQVHGFVSQSGGDVNIASNPGAGTTVTLYLPRSEAPVADDEDGIPGAIGAGVRGAETILIVEDDERVRDVAVAMIQEFGYKVLVAKDGVDALALVRSTVPVDLLFSDMLMPGGISGRVLAAQARMIQPALKILLTSGYPVRDDALADHGEFPVIQKPYRREKLAQMLRSALNPASVVAPAPAARGASR